MGKRVFFIGFRYIYILTRGWEGHICEWLGTGILRWAGTLPVAISRATHQRDRRFPPIEGDRISREGILSQRGNMDDDYGDIALHRERLQIQQIIELDDEELQVEEVEDHNYSDDNNEHIMGYRCGTRVSEDYNFDTCLPSLHTYLGEVEDTQHRSTFLDGGAVLNLPLIYFEGVVLFPESILPLRVIEFNFKASVKRALSQTHARYIIGVVGIKKLNRDGSVILYPVGTTAEIQQYRQLQDDSLNVVTRGRQRFQLIRHWVDVDGMPCGEVHIIQEDTALRTPRDVSGKLPNLGNLDLNVGGKSSDSEAISEDSYEGELSSPELRLHRSALHSCYEYDKEDESSSSDDDKFVCESEVLQKPHHLQDFQQLFGVDGRKSNRENFFSKRQSLSVPQAFWPYWVFRMYDSHCLAERAAEMWRRIVGKPNIDGLVKKPDLLSFYIASKIPVSGCTRQDLLAVNGVSYRLRREIKLLESFDCVRCKNCQTVIARRSDMLVMSNEGPLSAYVNPHGFVHEIMTLHKANDLALRGIPRKEYSWFPGYAWTITNCATCEGQMGWLFMALDNKLKPRSFWAIRISEIADHMP